MLYVEEEKKIALELLQRNLVDSFRWLLHACLKCKYRRFGEFCFDEHFNTLVLLFRELVRQCGPDG